MKANKTQIKKANLKLEVYGLELSDISFDKKGTDIKCFIIPMTETKTMLENCNMINSEIWTTNTLKELLFMSYFQ